VRDGSGIGITIVNGAPLIENCTVERITGIGIFLAGDAVLSIYSAEPESLEF
jgi:hypothetical protein